MRKALLAAAFVFLSVTESFAYLVAVWIPPWEAAALASVQTQASRIHESNPVWYNLDANGGIVTNWNGENPTWRAAMTGTAIVPTLQNYVNGRWDGALVASLISTPAGREAHAERIAQLVRSKAYDGIDIDYESMPTTSRANLSAFVATLADKLHASGKRLSFVVHAKTSDRQNWNGPGAQDWVAIGAAADSVKIMAYDYHWSTSEAGAITPLDWLEQVTAYAVSVIPPSKVMVGLPWYGYDWQGTAGKTVKYAQAMDLARANNATITRDVNGEATFTYSGRTVYFQDAQAYRAKIDRIVQKFPHIGGFAHWAAGSEDPAMWAHAPSGHTAGWLPAQPGVVPAPTPSTDFAVDGPAVLTLAQGKAIDADYRLVALNGFAGGARVSVEPRSTFDGTVTVSSAMVAEDSPVTVNVSAAKNIVPGVYEFVVRFTNGATVRDHLLSVMITAAPVSRQRAARR